MSTIRSKNKKHRSALCWWLVGFAVAYGEDRHGLIGTDMFALKGGRLRFTTPGAKEAEWMFDWAFAGDEPSDYYDTVQDYSSTVGH